jgi:ATP-dependent protease ClpP protease subunit
VFHFYISGPIEAPEHYTEMIHKIRTAAPHDTINIYLNTEGGQISTGVQIINAIHSTMGLVYTHLDGAVCSMGSLIFLAGHQMVAYEHSMIMFHNYSAGAWGKGHELKSMLDAQEIWYDQLQEKLCTPFLSKNEINRIKKGEDIWLHFDEITKRLEKVQKHLEEKAVTEEAKLSEDS